MNIALVTPPSPFLMDDRVFPQLGILYVAQALVSAGHQVEHLDLHGSTNPEQDMRKFARGSDAEVFGFTSTTPQLPYAVQAAEVVMEEAPNAKRILGGPHATFVKLSKSIRAQFHHRDLYEVFNEVIAEDSETEAAFAIDGISRPSMLCTPLRELIDMNSYAYTIDGEKATSLIAQRGCPMGCRFCSGRNLSFMRKMKSPDPVQVVEEVVGLYRDYGYKGFMFFDDELNLNPRMMELMELLADAAESLEIKWALRGFVKAERFTDEQAKAMRRAGFREIGIGFESASDRILNNINKVATKEDNTRALKIAKNNGLRVKALMSIGHPGENFTTLQETGDWLLAMKPESLDITIIAPYPGSAYWDEATPVNRETFAYRAPSGDAIFMRDADFMKESVVYKGIPGEYESCVWTEYLSAAELVATRDRMETEIKRALQ